MNRQVILHISDLHFSSKGDEQGRANRELLLRGLLSQLNSIETEWHPTLVCITGDITLKGQVEGYNEAIIWLKELAETLTLNFDRFFLCPGNHDCVRDIDICPPLVPNTPQEADKILTYKIPHYLEERFKYFSNFCSSLNIPPYKIGDQDSYLVGYREMDGIKIIACNTAWFSFEQDEHSKLWLGLEILRYLESKRQLVSAGSPPDNGLCIALMHHGTETYFQEHERLAYSDRPPALHYLWQRCHLALYGHNHERALDAPNQMKAHCWVVGAGATNAGMSHPNNINLIRVNKNGFELRCFEFNPAKAESPWSQKTSSKTYPWNTTKDTPDYTDASSELEEYNKMFDALRNVAIEYAHSIITLKSRQLKPFGVLPKQISLQVSVKPEAESTINRLSRPGEPKNQQPLLLSIYEAISKARLSLLLGDLGAGKSTLLAQLALIIGEHVLKCVPIFIPANSLPIDKRDGISDLMGLINKYISSDLSPIRHINLDQVIKEGDEILLLIDSLDEIERGSAVHLLRLLARLPDLYSHITVVLASRFAEMVGVDYERWQVLQVPPLSSNQKAELIKNEALAQGEEELKAGQLAGSALKTLEDNPSLNALANSPLAVRLLYNSLTSDIQTLGERTLGDLLYNLLLQRLGEWADKDLRISKTQKFESAFPALVNKAILLGDIAYDVLNHGTLHRDKVTSIIKEYLPPSMQLEASLITQEAITFFEDNGIITPGESITFVYQPLAQIAAGVYLSDRINQEKESIAIPNRDLWRVVSFAGSIIRRTGQIEESRNWFINYVEFLITDRKGITPACYICEELRDPLIAQKLIELLPLKGRRPLWYLENERGASSQAIASSLFFAGDKGFNWLFSEYLDPRIPPTNTGSALIQDVFKKWSLLAHNRLTPDQARRLAELVPFLLATRTTLGTFGFLENLAYLVTEAFSIEEYLWLCANELNSHDRSLWAKEQFRQYSREGKHQLVNAILERKPTKGGAVLWIELNPQKMPPVPIIRAILSASWADKEDNLTIKNALLACQEKIGSQHWHSFLRWSLTDPDHDVAAAAALMLKEEGESSLYLLGDALSKAISLSELGSKAEYVLKDLVSSAKKTDINWQTCLFGNASYRNSARPGSWRIFLDYLNNEAPENGSVLLINNIDKIGPFNLPRYPDIRLAFRNLLSGPNGQEYRKALRDALDHYSPSIRHSAAMILISSIPNDEGMALITAISFVGTKVSSDFWEWEKFLITLNYGPTVIENLKLALPSFSKRARIMALALLARNNASITYEDKRELVLGLTDWRASTWEFTALADCGIASEFAYSVLIKEINSHPLADCINIANALVRHHKNRLTPIERAKCYAATLKSNIGGNQVVSPIFYDQMLLGAIKHLRTEKSIDEFPRLLGSLIDSLQDPNKWTDILWDLFCSDYLNSLSDGDDTGLELLWLGQDKPDIGSAIGCAAKKILEDERIPRYRWVNLYHWLAVLADEFVGVDKNELKNISTISSHSYGNATYSILRRLGEVPTDFKIQRTYDSLPEDLHSMTHEDRDSKSFDNIHIKLLDAARESELIKSNIQDLVTSVVITAEISQRFLDELASKGNNGCLLAGVLAFCFDLKIRANYAFSFMEKYELPDRQNSPDIKRLKSIAVLAYNALIRMKSEIKAEYVNMLLQAMEREPYSKDRYIYDLILIERGIPSERIDYILQIFAGSDCFGYIDRAIVSHLSEWASDLDKNTLKDKLVEICFKCLQQLDINQGVDSLVNDRDASVYLFFPLLYWSIGMYPEVISERVFARGIKLMFDYREERYRQKKPQQFEVIESVAPLFSRIPKPILKDVLSSLAKFPDSDVRMWTNLFQCFQV